MAIPYDLIISKKGTHPSRTMYSTVIDSEVVTNVLVDLLSNEDDGGAAFAEFNDNLDLEEKEIVLCSAYGRDELNTKIKGGDETKHQILKDILVEIDGMNPDEILVKSLLTMFPLPMGILDHLRPPTDSNEEVQEEEEIEEDETKETNKESEEMSAKAIELIETLSKDVTELYTRLDDIQEQNNRVNSVVEGIKDNMVATKPLVSAMTKKEFNDKANEFLNDETKDFTDQLLEMLNVISEMGDVQDAHMWDLINEKVLNG